MNPFKPHVVKSSDDKYAVRQLRLSGWQYRDTTGKFWWILPEHVEKYAVFSNYIDALNCCNKLNIKWKRV